MLVESELGFSYYRQGMAVGATLKLYGETFGEQALNQATGGVTFGSGNDPTVQQIQMMSVINGKNGHNFAEAERLHEYRLGLTRGRKLEY